MATAATETLSVTIDAPFDQVASDLADPAAHPKWATEFFSGEVRPAEGDGVVAPVPMMGGEARFKIDADVAKGVIDLYLAPKDTPFGAPLPVRVVPNGDGVDVLWTLARPAGMPDAAWDAAVESMRRELQALRRRHED